MKKHNKHVACVIFEINFYNFSNVKKLCGWKFTAEKFLLGSTRCRLRPVCPYFISNIVVVVVEARKAALNAENYRVIINRHSQIMSDLIPDLADKSIFIM